MSIIDDGFIRVVNELQQMIEYLAYFADTLRSKIENFRNTTEPLSNESYEMWFNTLDLGRNVSIPRARQQVESLRTMTEEYNKNINRVDELHNEIAKIINENKFKYGLKGQIKKSLEGIQLPPGIPEEANHVLEQPYAPTPWTPYPPPPPPHGGKKSFKKRLRSKQSKKLRKK